MYLFLHMDLKETHFKRTPENIRKNVYFLLEMSIFGSSEPKKWFYKMTVSFYIRNETDALASKLLNTFGQIWTKQTCVLRRNISTRNDFERSLKLTPTLAKNTKSVHRFGKNVAIVCSENELNQDFLHF